MKYIYITLITALSLITVSCSDFLDAESTTSLPPEEVVKTIDDLKIAVNGVYYMQTSGMPVGIDEFMSTKGNYAGDYTIYADLLGSDCYPIGSSNQISPVARYQITKDTDLARFFYRRFYYTIARINKLLELTEASGLEGAEVDIQLGELYALRGLMHFDLAKMYAKLPSTASPSDFGIIIAKKVYSSDYVGTRSTLEDTYNEIVADLDKALTLLPEVTDTKNLPTGHINYWATRAIRSRVYLYLEKNDLALADAKYVIEKSPYTLYNIGEYEAVWSKQGTSESLFEFLVTDLYSSQRTSLGFYTHAEGYAECGITPLFKSELESRTTDVRGKLIAYEEDGRTKGYFPQKYPGRDNSIYVNNPKVIRLSEVYLIAAEAALKETGSGANYINDLRRNRITGYADVSSITIDDILMERRLELFAEGHQAWDAWRNKKAVVNVSVGIVNYNDNRTVLPIPISEINLSGGELVQNPGY